MSANLIALQSRVLGHGETVYDRLAAIRRRKGRLVADDVEALAAELSLPPAHVRSVAQFYDELRLDEANGTVLVRTCNGEACVAAGANAARERLEAAVRGADVAHGTVTCLGYCGRGPNALVEVVGRAARVVSLAPDGAAQAVADAAASGDVAVLREPVNAVHVPSPPRPSVLLRAMAADDPTALDPAGSTGAYEALERALLRPPEEIVEAVIRSGLRGRGGAGFPTGTKLRMVARADAPEGRRAIVLNADEGDAGAYIDKELLERAPHTVLEGMILAARATGAREGWVYLRSEYPRAHDVFGRAILAARAAGWLGEDIRGSGLSFDVRIVRGHGAYVCGEETALLRSIEGLPAQVTPKPPYPAERGLWGAPTLVANVETVANLPFIVRDRGEAFAALGYGRSRGTKLVSLNAAVVRPGLYEVEFGTTLREILFGLAGGIAGGRRFKAVQVGGPLGGVFAERHLDLPLDFEALREAGGLLGHGGMVVFTDADDMVVVGRGLMRFCAVESCGRCFPCRLGSVRGTELLDKVLSGRGTQADLDLLAELGETMRLGSLCALGGGIPVAIDGLMTWFADDFARHVPGALVPELLRIPAGGGMT